MKKIRKGTNVGDAAKVTALVTKLNRYRHEYSGSIRLLYPAACRKRHIHFYAFNVIEGMKGFGKIVDSRGKLLEALRSLGFEVCLFLPLTTKVSMEELEKLEHFTRDGINSRIISLGATAGSSVSRKTDYLICGEKPGSKLAKARELGIPVLTEQQFLDMIPA